MTEFFSQNEYVREKRKKTLMIVFYVIGLAVILIANVLTVLYLKPISYAGGVSVNIVLTAGYGCFSLFFFAMPYRTTDKYFKLLHAVKTGMIREEEGVFLYFDQEETVQDGVFFNGLCVQNDTVQKSEETVDRRILIACTHQKPDFHVGDKIRFRLLGSVLVAYEVTERIPDELLSEEERQSSAEFEQVK